MDAILNNPFRILGLEPTHDETIISERVSEILRLLTNGEEVSFPIDEFYNKILVDPYNSLYYNSLSNNIGEPIPTRNIESVKIAHVKLNDPIKRKYYALFSFKQDQIDNKLFNIDQFTEYLENDLNLREGRRNRLLNPSNSTFLNDFEEDNNANYIIEKEYNKLTIKNLTENGYCLKPKSIYTIDEDSNFSFKYDCEWIDGSDSECYSLFWGKPFNQNSYFEFGISADGYFKISDSQDGITLKDKNNFIGWTVSDSIIKYGKNNLEVRRNNNCLEFFINNKLVHKTTSYKKFYGEYFGFIVFGKQTVIFTDLKINYYREDIDYASDLIINYSNFEKVRNLTLHFLLKSYLFLNQPLAYSSGNSDFSSQGYSPSNLNLFLDKALLLFGKVFQKEVQLSFGVLLEGAENETLWEGLAQLFFEDLKLFLKHSFEKDKNLKSKGISFEERFEDTTLRKIKDDYSISNLETNFSDWKSKLIEFPRAKETEGYQFDIEFFRQSKISKSHFSSSINNPFRVLGLKHDATDREIVKRVSDLLVYAEMGKNPKYDTDLFFGKINRTIENIREASKKLENPNQKLYYTLLWFIELNELDKTFFNNLRVLDKGENTREFKSNFVAQAAMYADLKTNYFDAANSIYEEMFMRANMEVSAYFGSTYETEIISFCLHDDIIPFIPLNLHSQRIENQIVLNSNTDTGFWLLKEIIIDYTVDYEIEFDCEWLDGEDCQKLYSIVFSKDAGNNYYRFGISANGHLFFDAVVNGNLQNLYGWHRVDNINLKSKNHLKIAYDSERNEFNFYVNSKHFSEEWRFGGVKALVNPINGNSIGVSVFGKQKVSFSNFRMSYTHRIAKETSKTRIRTSNISSLINLVAANLCLCSFIQKEFYYKFPLTITLFGKILNCDAFHSFASKIIGEHTNIDIGALEKYFIEDIYNFIKPQFNKEEGVKVNEFLDAFYSFSNINQHYIVHKFIGRPILDIENSIKKTKEYLKDAPLQGLILGFNLFNSTNEDLITVRKILSYTNYQYRLLANNLSDTLLDCGIVYFNNTQNNREILLSEGNQILELVQHANKIAIDGNARKRVDENMVFFEKWVSEAQKKEQETIRLEQFRQKQEREKYQKEQELKRNITNASTNRPTTKPISKTKKDLPIFYKIIGIVFWPTVIVGIILYSVLSDNKKESSAPKNRIDNYSAPLKASKWKQNKLQNGSSPYDGIFGKGIYDYDSECWIIFKNGNSTDAIVCLENISNGRTIRNEYIQAGTDYQMTNIPEGVYKVKVFYGNDWNPERTLNNGAIRGAFNTDFSFSLSDKPDDLIRMKITETYKDISYTTGEITLYTVSNGNMNQRNINSNEFFK